MVYSFNMEDVKKYKVYVLKDKDGKIKYVGQTRQSLKKRYYGHKFQSSFKDEYFTIELVQSFDNPEPMYKLEAMLIEQYDLVVNGWNKAEGFKDCPEQFDGTGEKNAFYGHKHREDVCNKIGERSKGNKYAVGSKSRKGLKNKPEHQKALIESRERKILCLDTGEVFRSGAEAASKLGLKRSKICLVCKGLRKSTGGLRFSYVDNQGVVD